MAYSIHMKYTIVVEKAGRILLPKPVRDALQINPGAPLKLETFNDHIVLRPVRRGNRLYKKHGVWVLSANSTVPLSAETINRAIRRVRAERERHVLGKFKG